jgi:hypothetical protein
VLKQENIGQITYYEAANIIGRQMFVIDADKLNWHDLELMQKLILEFKDELHDLGVTVINIDHPFSALVSGDVRITPREIRTINPIEEIPSGSWIYDALEQLISRGVLKYGNNITHERPIINFQYMYPPSSDYNTAPIINSPHNYHIPLFDASLDPKYISSGDL